MTSVIATIFLLSPVAAAADDPPVFGRPSAHYYDAVGEHVRVEMTATPTDLRVEQEFTLTIRVAGAANPGEIRRPDLRDLDDFATRFFIDNLDDGPAQAAADRVFRYKLRPKNESVKEVPPLLFRYWQPRLQYFAATSPETAIPLMVRGRASAEATAVPLRAPDFLFEITEGSSAFAGAPRPLPKWVPTMVFFAPALACLVWYVFWWYASPGAVQAAHLRRVRAVRGALDALLRLHRKSAGAVAGEVAGIVRTYLRERWMMAVGAATPTETAVALRSTLPPALIEQVTTFFRACDAAHFGPAGSAATTLVVDAEKLIQTLEQHVRDTEVAATRGATAAGLALVILATHLAPALGGGEIEPLVSSGDSAFRAAMTARADDQKARPLFREAAEQYGLVRTKYGLRYPELLRNEGNARVLAGDFGDAIAVYRLALQQAANDVGLRRGLEYARSQVQFASPGDRARLTPPSEPFIGASRFLSGWVVVAIAVLAAAGWVGVTRWLMVRNHMYLVVGLVALGLGVALTATRLVADQYRANESLASIAVTSKPAILRLGDGPSFLPRLDVPLPAGVETVVKIDRGEWLQVELADGTLGWLPRDAVAK